MEKPSKYKARLREGPNGNIIGHFTLSEEDVRYLEPLRVKSDNWYNLLDARAKKTSWWPGDHDTSGNYYFFCDDVEDIAPSKDDLIKDLVTAAPELALTHPNEYVRQMAEYILEKEKT